MKIFELIFILLILLPLALIMRFFVSKLSTEKPQQRRSASEETKWTNPLKGGLARRKRKKAQKKDSSGPYQDPDTKVPPKPYYQTSGRTDAAYDARIGRPAEFYNSKGGRADDFYDSGKGRPAAVYDPGVRADSASSGVKSRRLAELKRTQRIPFSELYGKMDGAAGDPKSKEAAGSVSASVAQRVSERRAATKNAPRSEQEPSKRQKRKNRERARKRELARRDKGNNES